MFRRATVVSVIFALIGLSGCVGKKKYDQVVDDREELKMKLAKTRKQAAETEADLQSKVESRDEKIQKLEKKAADLEKKRKNLTSELETVEESLQEKLNATEDELAALREQQRQQKQRLQRYRDLARKLAETFKSEQLSVKVRDGKMVIEMSDDVLFNSGRAEVNENGKSVLENLAGVLQGIEDREFLVAGHTDDVPISSSRFDDNWELSSARAGNVVRLLAEKGVDPDNLSAAGFSKYDPIATNETEEGRAQNRRIEIVLMPKVSELPNLPEDLFESETS